MFAAADAESCAVGHGASALGANSGWRLLVRLLIRLLVGLLLVRRRLRVIPRRVLVRDGFGAAEVVDDGCGPTEYN